MSVHLQIARASASIFSLQFVRFPESGLEWYGLRTFRAALHVVPGATITAEREYKWGTTVSRMLFLFLPEVCRVA